MQALKKNSSYESPVLLNKESQVEPLRRSSRPEVFSKKGVLRNFAKFTGKHLCQSLFFNKVADLRSAALLKKRLWHRCFPVNFEKFLRTAFIIEHLRWLLLSLVDSKYQYIQRNGNNLIQLPVQTLLQADASLTGWGSLE